MFETFVFLSLLVLLFLSVHVGIKLQEKFGYLVGFVFILIMTFLVTFLFHLGV